MENKVNQNPSPEEQIKAHNELVQGIIEKVKSDKFTTYFYCPPLNTPSGGIAVLLRMAKTIKESGVNVKLVYEPRENQRASFEASQKQGKQVAIYDKFNPQWMEFDISDIEITALGDKELQFSDGTTENARPLSINPEDFLIIPEGFPDIMKKTMQVPCKRVVLAQSWFYILNAMNAGEKWQHFGIQDVISVSEAITEYLMATMPGLNVKEFSQEINRDLFKVPTKISDKFPMVGFMASRGPENRMKTHNIIKNFQAFYPHLKWVRFIELSGLSREEFAEKIASCAFVLYTDDIAGFGTLPLEAMASGTHVIGWASYGGKEYINENNGFWSNNCDIFQTAELLGVGLDKWLNGEMDVVEIQAEYEKTLERYTTEKEKTKILEIINEYKNDRINELEKIKK